VGRLPEIKRTPGRKIDVPENVLDTSKILSAIKWSPSVSLRDGIERTWKLLKESGAKQ
jgi:nucleoside-diphosphate-sugar epimerase